MEETAAQAGPAPAQSGALCLDFVDTVDWRGRARPVESLLGPADLLAWASQAELLTDAEAAQLRAALDRRPAAAAAAFAHAIAVRETIYRVFAAVAAGDAPAAADLAQLNADLADALGQAQVVPAGAGFAWGWRPAPDRLERVLWPVLRSAADLLTGDSLARLRGCAATECGWLFLDNSRNGSRRWCSMDGCGNRAKARRHYQRRAQGAP